MRADAYARFQTSASLLALRAGGATFDLSPPSAAELEDIVTLPVAACQPPLVFSDSSLASRLVADAQGGDALALLQMTLQGLYNAQEARGDGILKPGDYKGMAAAVTEAANSAMAHLGAGARSTLAALVFKLIVDVTSDPVTAEPTPIVGALDRDAFVRGKPEREALVDAFIEARLLTLEGGACIRPTHDALMRIWPEAANLVKELSALIRARHALIPLAEQWAAAEAAKKSRHLLLPAPLLASGQQLDAHFGDDLGIPLRPFIAEALKAAERSLVLATDAANSLVFDIARKFRSVSGVPTSLVKSVLDRARDLQQILLATGQSSPGLLHSQAAALGETSVTFLSLGDTKSALDAAFEARGILERLVEQRPDDRKWRRDLAVAHQRMGDVQSAQGRLAEALKSYKSASELAGQLVKSEPDSPSWQRVLSVFQENVGDIELKQGHFHEALDTYREGLAVVARLAKSDPANVELQRNLSILHSRIGDVEFNQGNLAQALRSYQADRAIAERLAKSDPANGASSTTSPFPMTGLQKSKTQKANPGEPLRPTRRRSRFDSDLRSPTPRTRTGKALSRRPTERLDTLKVNKAALLRS